MALVRRTSGAAVGRAQVPAVAGAMAPIPHQGGPGAPGSGVEMAAAVGSLPAKAWAVAAGLGLAGLGAVGAAGIVEMGAPVPFQVDSDVSAFGALFVFAAAVERVLEPFSRWMPGQTEQERYERAVADMDNGVPGATAVAAGWKAALDQARASRGLVMWGLATFVATLLSAGSGFYLLRMLNENPRWDGIAAWADALVTGLIVGSGTKPLHDIITKMQRGAITPQTPA